MYKITTLLFLAIMLGGCASRPVLYPNTKYKKVGGEIAEDDIDKCMADSEEYLKSTKGKQVAKSGGFGAAVGAAMGAVKGAFSGDIAGGLARGAAIGGAGGATAGAISPDKIKRRYTNHCLSKKGYKIIGWD